MLIYVLISSVHCCLFSESSQAEPVLSTCERTIPTQATSDYTSQTLTVSLDQSITDVSMGYSLYSCNSGKFQKFTAQNCSSIDLNLGPMTFNESVIVTFSPVCTGSTPPLDYSILMTIDFSFISKRYVAKLWKL